MHLILLTLPLITFTTVFSTTTPLLTDDFLQNLKQKATTWTPRQNFPIDTTIEQLQNLASLKGIHPNASFTFPVVNHKKSLAKVPTSFDSRSKWPKCSSMTTIRDQGQCGGCWAFAAAEVMSDRLCIATNGKQQFVFSPQDLISCCSDCGYGCEGGYLLSPYQYWISHGIPSGGDQGSGIGCKPFTARDTGVTPVCTRSCVNEQDYTKDLRYGVKAYQVVPNVEDIQQEISENGPVGTYFDVYLDFYYYGSGIYQHSYGSLVGGHAVKIIGWGEENGIPYWIVANSWGESWGENGFFKIRRGINNCQIETAIVAGKPNSTAGIYPENYSLLLLMSLIVIGVVFNKQ